MKGLGGCGKALGMEQACPRFTLATSVFGWDPSWDLHRVHLLRATTVEADCIRLHELSLSMHIYSQQEQKDPFEITSM